MSSTIRVKISSTWLNSQNGQMVSASQGEENQNVLTTISRLVQVVTGKQSRQSGDKVKDFSFEKESQN